MREHAGRGRADWAGPVVVHETEFVGEAVERGGSDAAARVFLRAVVEDCVVDGVGEAVAAEERDELEVVEVAARDERVDDGAFAAAVVLARVEDLGVDTFVDDDVGELGVDALLGQRVEDGGDLLVEDGLELALADAVALDEDARGLGLVEGVERLAAGQDAGGDLGGELFLEGLLARFGRVLAVAGVEARGEAEQAFAGVVPDVDAADHGRDVDAVGLHEPPGRAVVEFAHDLREEFADDGGDALAGGECFVQDALRGDAELGDGEALGEFVEVHVVLLAAARGEDEEEEVGVAEVAHVLEPLLGVLRALLHHGLVDVDGGALAGGLELLDEGVFGADVLAVVLEREDGPAEGGRRGVDAALCLAVEHGAGREVVRGGAEGDAAGRDAACVERAERGAVVVLAQPDAPGAEHLALFGEDALQELLLLAHAFVGTRLELHQLHHEAARAQFVVEAGFAAALGHELHAVGASAAAAFDFGDEHRLARGGERVAVALLEVVGLGDLARLAALARELEGAGRTQVEVDVDHAVGARVLVLGDDVAVAQAREQRVLQVAVAAEACAHVVHALEHVLVEVDLLGGVDFEEHAFLAADRVDLHVDGRAVAVDDAQLELGVDLLLAADVEELAADLCEARARLGAVEEVVEDEFLLRGGVGGGDGLEAEGGGGALLGDDGGDRGRAALGGDDLRAEDLELAELRFQGLARGAEQSDEFGGLERGGRAADLDLDFERAHGGHFEFE